MLSPTQIRAFLTVIESGSMNKTAKLLNCSQSTVSRLIEQMEDETGLVLFERSFSSKRIVVTKEGETIVSRCRHTLSAFEDLSDFCIGLSMGIEPEMKIALPSIFAKEKTQKFAADLISAFPNTRFSLLEPSLFQTQDKVLSGEIDLAVNVFIPTNEEGIFSIGLGTMEGYFVCHPEHPLMSLNRVNHSDLEMNCHITYLMPQCGTEREEFNFSNRIIEAESTEQVLMLTSSKLGYALISKDVFKKASLEYGLVRLHTDIDSRLVFPLHAMFKQVNQNRPINRWICDYLAKLSQN